MGKAPKAAKTSTDPAVEKRSELKKLALSRKILSDTASKPQVQLRPSKTVLKHHGKDIIKKSQRKNRFLFSFPGLVAPITGGKIGELKDLGTKNPILYLDFPQGQMKLFGTILYPKNRYLTLHFSRGGKNVMCEDYFDNMIVFSNAWWIGRKEDNPEETRLDFPKEMTQEQHAEYDFQAGAGGISIDKPVVNTTKRNQAEEDPHSGKRYSFKVSSDGDPDPSDIAHDTKETEEGSSPDGTDGGQLQTLVKTNKQPADVTKSKKTSQTCSVSLVQTTISALFKKAGEKNVQKNLEKSPAKKGSEKKPVHTGSKRKISQVDDEPYFISSEDADGSDEEWDAWDMSLQPSTCKPSTIRIPLLQ